MKKTIWIVLMVFIITTAFLGCSQSNEPAASESAAAESSAEATPIPPSESAAESTPEPSESASPEADAAADTSLQTVLDKGEFILGLDDSFPPMGYTDEGGEIVGFDIDLATEVCARLGVSLILYPIDWSAKNLELDSGNIDCIWNGYSVTPERAKETLLSDTYMQNMQVVVVTADSPIKTLDDLAGKKLGVQDGSSAQKAIADTPGLLDSIGEQVDFKENVTALMDLSIGQTDALAIDSVVADYYSAQSPGEYVILEETLAPEDFAIGFRNGDQALCDAVNQALDEMRADGTFAEISNKWFGRDVSTAA